MSGKKKILHSLGIGETLRELRTRYNLTLDQVSEDTKIASETIRRIELNKFEPKISTLEILSDYYRVDLIELIARKRKNISVFSEELITSINYYLNNQDFDGLKAFVESLLKSSELDIVTSNLNLKSFLYALKYIKYDPSNGQNDIIGLLEDILVNLSPTSKKINQSIYPFPLEVSISLLLTVVYRQNGNYQKSIDLLRVIINRIQNLPLINDRFSDYLASAYYNLAYTYHSSTEHQKVIDTINESFDNPKVNYTKTAISYLLFRKGVALLLLGDADYEAFIVTSLSLMDTETKVLMERNLLKLYGYEVKKK